MLRSFYGRGFNAARTLGGELTQTGGVIFPLIRLTSPRSCDLFVRSFNVSSHIIVCFALFTSAVIVVTSIIIVVVIIILRERSF